ncbi:MAG: PEP-CTERM sorting domain-containing protein [Planctomycetota bacterium]
MNLSSLKASQAVVLGLSLAASGQAFGVDYRQIISLNELHPTASSNTSITGVTEIGGEFLFTISGPVFGDSLIVLGDGSNILVDSLDYANASGEPTQGFDLGQAALGLGNPAIIADRRSDAVYSLNLSTGALTSLASNADLNIATTGTSANLTEQAIDPDGNIVVYETNMSNDSLLLITPGGAISELASASELTTNVGNNTLNGFTISPTEKKLFFGDDGSDNIYSLDYSGASNDYEIILTEAQIIAVTGRSDVRVDKMLYAPDGLIYFYEDGADSIYSFDPDNAPGTLSLVISDSDLIAGPAENDIVGGLTWVNGNIGWWYFINRNGEGTGLYAIPEPTSLAIFGVGAMLLGTRRRQSR